MKKKYDLEDRLVEFATNSALFIKDFPNDLTGQYYGNQLIRSAGSAALNFGEAQGTNNLKDNINKLTISVKELKESRVNLRIVSNIGIGSNKICLNQLDEVEQLIRIVATIIKNKKSKHS